MSGSPLTFLLPVRGRHLHTLRLLWHANSARNPYRFLLADGEGHPAIVALLTRPARAFPNLDIEYINYPDDGSYAHYYRRTADAAKRVSTPYVMTVGNDDLILAAGLATCVEFLDSHREYACCGGGVAGFSLTGSADRLSVVGSLSRLDYPIGRYYEPRTISQDSALERITSGFADYLSSYHNVFRTNLLADIYREVEDQNFSIIHFREAYQSMRTFSAGKVTSDPTIINYLRQRRLGRALGGDLIRLAFHPPFGREFDAMVARLAATIGAVDGVPAELADVQIRDAYAEFFRRKAAGSIKKSSAGGKPASKYVDPIGSADRRIFFNRLAEYGASKAYIASFRRDFDEAEATLRGTAFIEFVREHAVELLDGERLAQ